MSEEIVPGDFQVKGFKMDGFAWLIRPGGFGGGCYCTESVVGFGGRETRTLKVTAQGTGHAWPRETHLCSSTVGAAETPLKIRLGAEGPESRERGEPVGGSRALSWFPPALKVTSVKGLHTW